MGFNAYQMQTTFRSLDAWISTLNQQAKETAAVSSKVQRGTFNGGMTDQNVVLSSRYQQFAERQLQLTTNIDFSQGDIASSHSETHLAPRGPGFMMFVDEVNSLQRRILLSRDGELHWDADGFLRNNLGLYVTDRTVIEDPAAPGAIPPLDDGTGPFLSRDRIRVTHGDPLGLPANSKVQLRVNLQRYVDQGLMQADLDDLRITYWDGTAHQILPIFVDTSLGLADAVIIFETPVAIDAGEYNDNFYLHYNNPAAGPGPAAPFGPLAAFGDDFNDVTPSSIPPVRFGWSLPTGAANANWAIQNGGMVASHDPDFELVQTVNTSSVTKIVASVGYGWDDYRFSGSFGNLDSDNDDVYIYFRYQDDNNYYRLVQHTGGMPGQSRRFERVKDGVVTTLIGDDYLPPGADIGSASSSGPWRSTFDVEVKGAAIRLYQNGELVFDAIDPDPILTGTIGMGNYSQPAWYDDIQVQGIEPASAQLITSNGAIRQGHWESSGLSWAEWVEQYFDLVLPSNLPGLLYAPYGSAYFDLATSRPGTLTLGRPGENGLAYLVTHALEQSNARMPAVSAELALADKVYDSLVKVMQVQIGNLDLLMNIIR